MGIDTRTGELIELSREDVKQRIEKIEDLQARLREDPDAEIPDVVAVPPSYVALTPAQRLALAFGAVRGKDRKAAHAGQHTKPRTKERRDREARAEHRARMRANRQG